MLASLLFKIAATLPEWESAKSALFLRAETCPELLEPAIREKVLCHQTFFPDHEHLKSSGARVTTKITDQADFILYCGTKFKEENIFFFQEGLRLLKPGGTFLCVLPNELGAARFEKIFHTMIQDEQFSVSKSKSRIFGVRNFSGSFTKSTENTDGDAVGIFSSSRVDDGSKLLARHFEGKLHGAGADLGAGTGFLSIEALKTNPDISSISLYEAEKKALDLAKASLADNSEKCSFEWSDVTRGIPEKKFDWIVSNPPFHYGNETKPEIGIAFIKAAMKGLKPGGLALFVQNKHLPYLSDARKLGTLTVLSDANGYLVWELQKQK